MIDLQSGLQLLDELNYSVWHDDMRESYISLVIDNKKRLMKLKSSEFKRLFCYKYEVANNNSPSSKLIKGVVTHLDGKAIYESELIEPDVRLIGNTESIEIDLCDSSFNVVRIGRGGFEIAQPERHFLRRHGLLPLPVPVELTPEECRLAIDEFKGLLNVTDDQFILVIGAILMSFHPSGPYPVLFVQGEHGSAKGSLCEAVKWVVDPNKTPHTTLPKDVNDLVIQAASNRVLSFDNVSDYTFNKKLSDMFAQVATGIGLRKRQLYTDDGECVINVSRMIMMNGIDDVVTQSDLVSRAIGLRLNPVNVENRISKSEFNTRLKEVQVSFFSAMVKAISCILRNHEDTKIVSGARMFDMIHWVTAGEEALGWEAGTFQQVYEENQKEMTEIGLGEDPLAAAIIRYMSNKSEWIGNASRLLSCLNASTERGLRNTVGWPRSPISLGRSLNRINTSLRSLGIEISRPDRSSSERLIEIANINLRPDNKVN